MAEFEAILSQGDNGLFVTLRTSGTPASQAEGREDYWSLSSEQAYKLGVALVDKAFEAQSG